MNNYRKDIESKGLQYCELTDYGYDDNKEFLVPESCIVEMINNIKTEVNEIKNLLDDINGLTEIDEIKEKVNELSLKLY